MNIIKTISGLCILFLLNFLSIKMVTFFHIPFPSPLIGMITLVILMHFKILPSHFVEDACTLLLKNMSMFFVPLLVGICIYFNLIKHNAIPIVLTILITTIVILCTTGKTVEYFVKRRSTVK